MLSVFFPSVEGREEGPPGILGVKRGDERQRGENLDRKMEQFTENRQIANKHMEPSLTLLNSRKVCMYKNFRDTCFLIRYTETKNLERQPVLAGFGETGSPVRSG